MTCEVAGSFVFPCEPLATAKAAGAVVALSEGSFALAGLPVRFCPFCGTTFATAAELSEQRECNALASASVEEWQRHG